MQIHACKLTGSQYVCRDIRRKEIAERHKEAKKQVLFNNTDIGPETFEQAWLNWNCVCVCVFLCVSVSVCGCLCMGMCV